MGKILFEQDKFNTKDYLQMNYSVTNLGPFHLFAVKQFNTFYQSYPSKILDIGTGPTIAYTIRPLQYNSLFLITTVDAGGRSISLLISSLYTSKQHFLHALHLSEPRVEAPFLHYVCTQEHHHLLSTLNASNTCKPYWPKNSINYRKRVCSKQRTHSFPLDFK